MFVLPRLRGLAVDFLFNIIFSYLTFQMLNSKRFRYIRPDETMSETARRDAGKNELIKTARGVMNTGQADETV